MGKDLIEEFNERLRNLKILRENSSIKSAEECSEALGIMVSLLQNLNNAIELKNITESIDELLPGNSLRESGMIVDSIPDVETYCKTSTYINDRISQFLSNQLNENQVIPGINELLNHVRRYASNVQSIINDHPSGFPKDGQLRSWVNTFCTILGTFNRLLIEIDAHNSRASGTQITHEPVKIPSI
jgi:hypothetical protein